MIDSKSFDDSDLKKYWVKGDKSKIASQFHEDLDMILGMMNSSHNLSLVSADPSYHFWPNTPKGINRVRSLDLNGNTRLLFQFDEARGYFCHIKIDDPHKKGKKIKKK